MGIALGLLDRQADRHLRASRSPPSACGWRDTPEGATWPQIFGVAMLGGIGFTMSLFIGMLAFTDAERAAEIRIGVLLGSLASALAGYLVLRAVTRPAHAAESAAVHASRLATAVCARQLASRGLARGFHVGRRGAGGTCSTAHPTRSSRCRRSLRAGDPSSQAGRGRRGRCSRGRRCARERWRRASASPARRRASAGG